ncbi:MAG: glycosyltransferase family 4 protein [Bacillota bacterium]|nr:glycosyltransferase family 4 protein [Bacillota bacterium]
MKILLVTRTTAALGHSSEYLKRFNSELSKNDEIDEIKCFVPKINFGIESLNNKLILSKVDFSTNKKDLYKKKYGVFWKIIYGIKRIMLVYEFLRDLFERVDIDNYDIIHFLEIEYFSYYLYFKLHPSIAKRTNIIFVSHSGNFSYKKNNGTSKVIGFYKYLATMPLRYLYDISKGVMVHGENIKRQFIETVIKSNTKCKKKIFVAEYGSEEYYNNNIIPKRDACEYLGIDEKRKNILFFGMIREDKGIRDLLKAIRTYNSQEALFIIAGKPYDISHEEILRLISMYELESKIKYIPEYIDEEEIKYYFCAADALIVPYKKEFSSQSGPLKMALSYSLPVICSDVGDIGEFTVKNKVGLIFEPENIRSIQDAIDLFLEMSIEDVNLIRENCKNTSRLFSWSNMLTKVFDRYKLILNLSKFNR